MISFIFTFFKITNYKSYKYIYITILISFVKLNNLYIGHYFVKSRSIKIIHLSKFHKTI